MKTKEEKRLMEQKMREAEQLAVKLVEQSERRSEVQPGVSHALPVSELQYYKTDVIHNILRCLLIVG